MSDRPKPRGHDAEEIIAAFDRERAEAHELHRRHQEAIENSRRNDRPPKPHDDDHHR